VVLTIPLLKGKWCYPMIENTRQGILDLLVDLVKVPGISATPAEVETGRFIHSRLNELPYFRENPENLLLLPIPGDPFGREVVIALVVSATAAKRTVILTGHYDVVGTADFGPLEDLAFSPLEYTEAIKGTSLVKDAEKDLRSGDYLFGRGVMDMKCGLAAEMALLAEASKVPSNMDVNLLFLAVPDEEVGSAGMRAAVPMLSELQDERGLDFLGAVLTEPGNAGAPGEEGEFIFLGAVGKLMPFFYCVGKGSHVGKYFEGFNASLLAANILLLVEGNPALAESSKGETSPPPACLFIRDIRDGYSVTLPDRAAVFFNLLTLEKTPAEVIPEMKKIAGEAFKRSLDQVRKSASEMDEAFEGSEPEVLTFEEFASRTAAAVGGDAKGRIRELVEAMDPSMDDRQRSLAIVTEMLSWAPPSSPVIITGFLPPYYPHRRNGSENEGDRRMRKVADRVIDTAKNRFGVDMTLREYFAGICDLSYMGFQGSSFDVLCMASNTPGWGSVYRLAMKELMGLHIPVLNLGPSGKDPHKPTERLRLSYSLEIFPELLREAVISMGKV